MRFLRLLALLIVSMLLLLPTVAIAQDTGDPAVTVDWMQILSLAINSVFVVLAVQLLKGVLTKIPGGIKQVLALVAGPLLLFAQSALSGWLGYPIDFSPLIQLIGGLGSGLAAMGLFDVGERLTRA